MAHPEIEFEVHPEVVLEVGIQKSESLDLRFQGSWGVGHISAGFRPEDRRPLSR